MTTIGVQVGECFFWFWLTQVVPDKIHRAIKWLCVRVCDILQSAILQKLRKLLGINAILNTI